MKKFRQLHLWIGLFASILILIEAVTGLLMVEPWLIGANKPAPEQRVQQGGPVDGGATVREGGEYARPAGPKALQDLDPGTAGRQNSLIGLIKGLHAGRIGNMNLHLFLDLVAVALIILTTTGIVLSINTLKAQSAARKKK